ncbi:MAG: 30S ribosomal protein S17 [Candidatus Levybacteria bacterium]|nr:30S ribosomal protein S17 [Candidatus Levybacteria bacterium]MDZ4227921.1 30S ribosomal protein S17 [Candidatus Levybacteria bacterium]
MKKIFEGTVVSVKMQNTVVVNVVSKSAHPLYKKLIKKSNKINVDTATFKPSLGDIVKIAEVKPISKTKHFVVTEVKKNGTA